MHNDHLAEQDKVPTETIRGMYMLGLRLMRYEQFAEARLVIQDASRHTPSDPDAYKREKLRGCIPYNLAYAEMHLGNTEEAIRLFHESIRYFPGNFLAYAALRQIYQEKSDRRSQLRLTLLWWKNKPAVVREMVKFHDRKVRLQEMDQG